MSGPPHGSVEVSREASEAGRRSTDIRDGSTVVADKVQRLRTELVRVIRTSTADVDRRLSTRLNINRQGTLQVNGEAIPVTVRNLSLGGALLEAVPVCLTMNTSVTLAITGMVSDLPGTVTRVGDRTVLVQFALNPEQSVRLTVLVSDRQAAQRADPRPQRKWQATRCPSALAFNGGTSLLQTSLAIGQRV
ncbi:PilZ domain-containing protein [Bradyrhizobium sp. SZCCHNRI2007]|uniref:PilZ domain-containing protein n=1 Tax=Bradyrhizobium sp. SZCCHNRI2007 TaxID=3057281 RepID=UPI0028E86E83|nr:PilZ domain-containing protein [Bradyrhizobium sp. SZCCHNRI2007]